MTTTMLKNIYKQKSYVQYKLTHISPVKDTITTNIFKLYKSEKCEAGQPFDKG